MEFLDAEGVVFHGAPLVPVEDLGHMFAVGASGMGVEFGEGVPVLCLEAVQDGLEDGVGVMGQAPIQGFAPPGWCGVPCPPGRG